MRIGQNPAKTITSVSKPERVTVAVLNFIPFTSGFYVESLEVLNACLTSCKNEAGLPFDLMVFDNGSCIEVKEWLLEKQNNGLIDILILSDKNLGKGGAWNQIFGGAPGEIIVYSDSDVLFYPGWLTSSIELLEKYPKAGMVTARPFRTREKLSSSTVEWARRETKAKLEEGQFIAWETYLEFNLSLGVSEEEIRQLYKQTQDYKITYDGLESYIGASHWQFMTRKKIVSQFLPFEFDRPMGQVLQLDELMNAAGYLRLMVTQPLAMNMSNTLPDSQRKKGRVSGNDRPVMGRKILECRPVKAVLMKIYHRIFGWYNN